MQTTFIEPYDLLEGVLEEFGDNFIPTPTGPVNFHLPKIQARFFSQVHMLPFVPLCTVRFQYPPFISEWICSGNKNQHQ